MLAGWPFGLVFWPLDAALRPRGRVEPAAPRDDRRGGPPHVRSGCARSSCRPWRGRDRGSRLRRSRRTGSTQSASGHLLGWTAVLPPARAPGIERARVAGRRLAVPTGGERSPPLPSPRSRSPGQLHLALGAVPFVLVYALRAPPADSPLLDRGRLGGRRGDRPRSSATRSSPARRRTRDARCRGAQVPGRVGRPLQPLAPARERGVRLLRLAHARARRRRAASSSGVDAVGWPCCSGWRRIVPVLLALGTTSRRTRCSGTRSRHSASRGCPERFMPIADLALAALLAFAVAELGSGGPGGGGMAVTAVLLVLVALDLGTQPVSATAADPDNAAYAAPRSPGASSSFRSSIPGSTTGASTTTTSCRLLASARRATTRSPRGAPTPSRSPTTGSRCGVWRAGRRSDARATRRHERSPPRGGLRAGGRPFGVVRVARARRGRLDRRRRRAARSRSSSAAVVDLGRPVPEPARTSPSSARAGGTGR